MEKISNFQIALMVCALTLDATLVSVPGQMMGIAKQDAWLSYPIALIIPLTAWWMICKVLARFPNQDLFSIMLTRFPLAGRVLSGGYILFFLVILSRDIRMLADFISIIMLQQTPMVVIILLAMVTMIWMARGGIELLGRMSEIYQTAFILVILSLPLFLAREFDSIEIRPFLGHGFTPVLQGSWLAVAYIGEIIAIPFLFSGKQKPLKAGIAGLFLGIFLLELLIIFNIAVLGADLAPRFMFPNQELIREIRITDFLDRLDLPIIGIWIPAMIVKTAFSLYFICHGLKRMIPEVSPKGLAAPVGLFSLCCSLWFFEDSVQILNWNKTWPLVSLWFQWLLPILFFFVLKPKKGDKGSRQ